MPRYSRENTVEEKQRMRSERMRSERNRRKQLLRGEKQRLVKEII